MNQGNATTANATSPRHGKIDRTRPPTSQTYGTIAANGISSATGPLVSPPAPAAPAAATRGRAGARRGGRRGAAVGGGGAAPAGAPPAPPPAHVRASPA